MKKELKKFVKTLAENGEMFFASGDDKRDFEFVKGVLEAQGFWSGVYKNYYFNDKLELINVKERW